MGRVTVPTRRNPLPGRNCTPGQRVGQRAGRLYRDSRSFGSFASPLIEKLEPGHHGVQVTEEEKTIIKRWLDVGATADVLP